MSDVVAEAPATAPAARPDRDGASAATSAVHSSPSSSALATSVDGEAAENASAERIFSTALLVSATRCLLTYIVLPFVAPALGFATGVGPGVGIAIGVVAIGANLVTIRRFHQAKHRLRWSYTAIASCVLGLLLVLMIQDIARII